MYLPEIPPDHPAEALAVALGSVVILSALWGTGPVASICTLWFALTAYAWWAPRTAARFLRYLVVVVAVLLLLGVRLVDLPGRLVARCRLPARRDRFPPVAVRRRPSRRRADVGRAGRPPPRPDRTLPTQLLD